MAAAVGRCVPAQSRSPACGQRISSRTAGRIRGRRGAQPSGELLQLRRTRRRLGSGAGHRRRGGGLAAVAFADTSGSAGSARQGFGPVRQKRRFRRAPSVGPGQTPAGRGRPPDLDSAAPRPPGAASDSSAAGGHAPPGRSESGKPDTALWGWRAGFSAFVVEPSNDSAGSDGPPRSRRKCRRFPRRNRVVQSCSATGGNPFSTVEW